MPKYRNRDTAINESSIFQDILDRRGVKKISQLRTMPFSGLDISSILVSEYIWTTKDSLHRVSQTFYGTYEYWWVIAMVNQKPTDAHYKNGDIIYIPSNPSSLANKIGS